MGVDEADLQPLRESVRSSKDDDSEPSSMETKTNNDTVNMCSFGDYASDSQEAESSCRQAEVKQLDERIATLQFDEQSQYATISALETSLDNRHAHLAGLEARVAELEARGHPDLAALREMSQKQVDIAATLRRLITDNQEQAQARAKIIESQRQQLTARHRRNLLKQAEGDEVAAKLLATRRETMRLRSKIRDLKLQHARLQEMKEAQQQQLQSSVECSGSASTVGQAAFYQHFITPQVSQIPCDRSDGSPSPTSIAAESASQSVSVTNTSDTDCSDSDRVSSQS